MAHRQKEYGKRAMHDVVEQVIREALQQHNAAVVRIDTCLEANANGFATPAQIESLIGKMDAVVTTRLHGTVLALKNGVPPVAVDPIAGGVKIADQCRCLGWPYWFVVDQIDATMLTDALQAVLQPEAHDQALTVRDRAIERLKSIRKEFLHALQSSAGPTGARS